MATKKSGEKPWWIVTVKRLCDEIQIALTGARQAIDEYDDVSGMLDQREKTWDDLNNAASELEDMEVDFRVLVDSVGEKTKAFKQRIKPLAGLRDVLEKVANGEPVKASAAAKAPKKKPTTKSTKSTKKKPAAAKPATSKPAGPKKPAAKKSSKHPSPTLPARGREQSAAPNGKSATTAQADELVALLKKEGACDAVFVGRRLSISTDAARGRLERMTKSGAVKKVGTKYEAGGTDTANGSALGATSAAKKAGDQHDELRRKWDEHDAKIDARFAAEADAQTHAALRGRGPSSPAELAKAMKRDEAVVKESLDRLFSAGNDVGFEYGDDDEPGGTAIATKRKANRVKKNPAGAGPLFGGKPR